MPPQESLLVVFCLGDDESFCGFRLHLRTSLDGVIPGDRNSGSPNSGSPALQSGFRAAGGELLAPSEHAGRDPDPRRSAWLPGPRRRIEPAIWHPEHRLVRKLLGYTVAIRLNVQAGHEPLQFDLLAA